ncbi:hypothetical protein D5S18_11040 [Nocardia panacis]|uniref:Uncharacterized protein n=1 Tax=Nocardia panacis TaxID=2340916 RepID=A0A3A4K6R4_9NOCA|nr:hypothetical protein [Nocardia panacis]RJO76779.1 hypothetical protein D5S18_11040 [Nocardia panacis]
MRFADRRHDRDVSYAQARALHPATLAKNLSAPVEVCSAPHNPFPRKPARLTLLPALGEPTEQPRGFGSEGDGTETPDRV